MTYLLRIRKNNKTRIVNYEKKGYLFVLPYVFGFVAFMLLPIFYTFYLSFTDLKGMSNRYQFIGFANYIKLLNDKFFIQSFVNTWKLWIPNFILQLGFALLFAAWLSDKRLNIKYTNFFRTVFYLPNLITAASVAVLFEAFFSYPNGPVNQFLRYLGITEKSYNFLMNPIATSLLVSFIQFWMWYGHTLIILYASMIGISDSLYEAAIVDGATSRQIFFKITLPILKPIILYVFTTSLVGGMQLFDIPFLITDGIGSPNRSIMTMTMYLYMHGFTGLNNYSYAATIAVGQFTIIMICALLIRWFLRDKEVKVDT